MIIRPLAARPPGPRAFDPGPYATRVSLADGPAFLYDAALAGRKCHVDGHLRVRAPDYVLYAHHSPGDWVRVWPVLHLGHDAPGLFARLGVSPHTGASRERVRLYFELDGRGGSRLDAVERADGRIVRF